MDQLDAIDLLYSLSGLVVGVLIGMTGIGGGSLMTPVLILIFGVHPDTAVGTDLLYASATKTVGTGVHSISRSVDWQIVRVLPPEAFRRPSWRSVGSPCSDLRAVKPAG